MQQHRETSRSTLAAQSVPKSRIVSRMLASLIGIGLVLFMLFTAGVDPWCWWLEYQGRADKSPLGRDADVTPPGQVSAVQPEPVGTESSIAVLPAPLLLKATRPGRNACEGHADLGVIPASPQTHGAGAILANGAQIEEIHSDHVVLARDGQRVRLYVGGHSPADSPPSGSDLVMVGGADPPAPTLPSSTDELTDHIRVASVYRGDAIHALEVYSTHRSNVFAALGLEPGDRITGISGEAITDSSAAIASLRRITQGAALQVTVERSGRSQTLSLNGLILTAAQTPDEVYFDGLAAATPSAA